MKSNLSFFEVFRDINIYFATNSSVELIVVRVTFVSRDRKDLCGDVFEAFVTIIKQALLIIFTTRKHRSEVTTIQKKTHHRVID